MAQRDDEPILPFASAAEWAEWLAAHHESTTAVWIRFPRKATGIASVTYAEALEEALRYGWIDGQARGIDETWYSQRWTPRRRGSRWSKINRQRAEEMIAAGRMAPAGLRAVEQAKASGQWAAAYDAPSTATIPDDLRQAFDAHPKAAEFFATLDGRNRYSVLHRIQAAKQAATRERRTAGFVEMLARGETPYPQKKRPAGRD